MQIAKWPVSWTWKYRKWAKIKLKTFSVVFFFQLINHNPGMAGLSDCFSIGSIVSCKTCHSDIIEGEVVAFEPHTKTLILSILYYSQVGHVTSSLSTSKHRSAREWNYTLGWMLSHFSFKTSVKFSQSMAMVWIFIIMFGGPPHFYKHCNHSTYHYM